MDPSTNSADREEKVILLWVNHSRSDGNRLQSRLNSARNKFESANDLWIGSKKCGRRQVMPGIPNRLAQQTPSATS
jgi:hypothetical protein